ncbi:MAG: SIS domain-containing protein [Ideonella sp.]|nr:SIS domain-containing protein [Ideonella sp.]MBL0150553.1 SIS domain-containing protein [Ideonella sp.]
MLEQRIQQHFFESADLQYQAADLLARPIAEAAQAVVAGITAGGRVYVAGFGPAAGLAQLMASQLLGRFERDRPGLAALALGTDGAALAALASAGDLDAVLARQVQTLGQPGDLLLLIDPDGDRLGLHAVAQAAQGKEMTVIALTGRQGSMLREALGETDVVISVPHDRRARVLETQLLVLHCLCDTIDLQLLGEMEPT